MALGKATSSTVVTGKAQRWMQTQANGELEQFPSWVLVSGSGEGGYLLREVRKKGEGTEA